jgi:HSP20 family protein
MTNVKFNLQPFEKSINSFVNDLFAETPVVFKNDFNKTGMQGFVPANVKETVTAFELELAAPGFEKDDFKINLEADTLTVSADRKDEVKQENEKQIRREYSFKSFKRSFTLDDKIDATKIDAKYINGILRLNFPKKAEVKPSATEIKIS